MSKTFFEKIKTPAGREALANYTSAVLDVTLERKWRVTVSFFDAPPGASQDEREGFSSLQDARDYVWTTIVGVNPLPRPGCETGRYRSDRPNVEEKGPPFYAVDQIVRKRNISKHHPTNKGVVVGKSPITGCVLVQWTGDPNPVAVRIDALEPYETLTATELKQMNELMGNDHSGYDDDIDEIDLTDNGWYNH
jgi:hypothetical protein